MTGADADRRFMAEAIALGRSHLGQTWPNPSVGAVVVVPETGGGTVVGRGVTAIGGRPHAEPQALAEAGEAARGATLYVTLEPCSHHGRTPPCAEAVIAAGIRRVVVACDDPDPRVAGRGYGMLRAAGIEVVTGVMGDEARRGLAPHVWRVSRGRPFVTLKMAISADGRIGRTDRGNVAVTGEVARDWTHRLRAESDAILIGTETARLDDPALTVRLAGLEGRSPVRVVVDRLATLAPGSRLAGTAREVPVWLMVGAAADPARRAALEALGVRVFEVAERDGHLDPAAVLRALAEAGIGSVMIEGGARQASAFLEAGLVDEIAILRGPAMLGEDAVPAPAALLELDPAAGWRHVSSETLGPDRADVFRRGEE